MPDPGSVARPQTGAPPSGSCADAVPPAGVILGDHEPVRVIVIDGEEGMREGMRRVLERSGFVACTAPDGDAGLRLMEERPVDVAFVSLRMPGIDGLTLTEEITQRFEGRTVVVVMSALESVEAAVEVVRHGAFDFLVKPFTPEELSRVAERAAHQWRLMRERERYLSELAGERYLWIEERMPGAEGVVVFNIRREPVLVNPRAEHFLSTRFREGMTLSELVADLDVAAAIEAVVDSAPARPECRLMQLSIADKRLQVSISPLLRESEAGGAIVILSDITDTWRAEQDKNRFVSMVAHELKSPLSAIINYINVILTGMFDDNVPKMHEMLDRCKIRGEALLDLVRDLLYINSREVGKVERTIEQLDLKAVLSSQLDFMKVQSEKKKIVMHVDAPLAAYPVKADRGDLDRIFMNLISNAIKYNRDKGSVTVRITDAGSGWDVAVVDTGIGLSESEKASLFQEFFRVKNQKTAGIAGTGLGLATVKRVLAGYGGQISVDSRPDAGSTFTVHFPRT